MDQYPLLTERLGFPKETKALIVTCDCLGFCHSCNIGVYDVLRNGIATSARLIVPAPWSRDAVVRYRGEDVGVELTLNSSNSILHFGPLTQAPSLLDGQGGFPITLEDLWDHADLAETRRECRAQIERAIYWGFDVSHIASELDALIMRPEFFDILLELAMEFDLPISLPDYLNEERIGFPVKRLAFEEGAIFPDRVIDPFSAYEPLDPASQDLIENAIFSVEEGVTELCIRPAQDTPELRAITPEWATFVSQKTAASERRHFDHLLSRANITLIGYREIRNRARAIKGGTRSRRSNYA